MGNTVKSKFQLNERQKRMYEIQILTYTESIY